MQLFAALFSLNFQAIPNGDQEEYDDRYDVGNDTVEFEEEADETYFPKAGDRIEFDFS